MPDHMTPKAGPPEQRLAALFAADEAPATDPVFVAELAERIAFRRAVATFAAMVPWAIAATAILWALAPVILQVTATLEPLLPAMGGLALAAVLAMAAILAEEALRRRLV